MRGVYLFFLSLTSILCAQKSIDSFEIKSVIYMDEDSNISSKPYDSYSVDDLYDYSWIYTGRRKKRNVIYHRYDKKIEGVYKGRIQGGRANGFGEFYSRRLMPTKVKVKGKVLEGEELLERYRGLYMYPGGVIKTPKGYAYTTKLKEKPVSKTDFPNDWEILEYENDDRLLYRGNWLDGVPHGKGELYNSLSELPSFEGDFEYGKITGLGKKFLGKKILYDGQWSKGKYNGLGDLYDEYSGKLIFSGVWKNGVKDNRGIEDYHSSEEYDAFNGNIVKSGEWEDDKFIRGVVYYQNGNYKKQGVFNNEFTLDLNGKGIEYYPNGVEFKNGTFNNGVFEYGRLNDFRGRVVFEGNINEQIEEFANNELFPEADNRGGGFFKSLFFLVIGGMKNMVGGVVSLIDVKKGKSIFDDVMFNNYIRRTNFLAEIEYSFQSGMKYSGLALLSSFSWGGADVLSIIFEK